MGGMNAKPKQRTFEMPINVEQQRLRWQCRRGLLELDYILQHYLDACFEGAKPQEQAQFIQLLQQQDDTLQAWLLEGMAPEKDFAEITHRLHQQIV